MITQERLKEVLYYHPSTGVFTWRIRMGKRGLVGKIAGYQSKRGYIQISIDGVSYMGHQLAWLYVHGVWPKLLDHEDTNKSYNAIHNLRLATGIENNANVGLTCRNKSGFKGVCWVEKHKRWRANIGVGGKKIHLGMFSDPALAHEAYKAAATQHFGEYARFE